MKKLLPYTCLMVIILIISSFQISVSVGEAYEEQDVKIDVIPQEALFNITNMKPGDWTPRSIVVQNNGTADIKYELKLQNKGEEKLFNQLLLEIDDADNYQLFNGLMADFNGLSPRELTSSKEETLHMTVRFPEALGNDYQGLEAYFSLLIAAEGSKDKYDVVIDSVVGSDGDIERSGESLPKTATPFFTFLLIGGILLISGGFVIVYSKINRKTNNK